MTNSSSVRINSTAEITSRSLVAKDNFVGVSTKINKVVGLLPKRQKLICVWHSHYNLSSQKKNLFATGSLSFIRILL